MLSFASYGEARRHATRHMPSSLYMARAGLPPRERLYDLLIVESDGEWWYNPESLDKQLKLHGLTEFQENVKLCVGYTECPSCKADLAPPSGVVGFYDYDVDHVRIQHQFACKKCRHQWGPRASGPRDSALVAVAAERRDPITMQPRAPRAKTAGGPSVRDQIHAILNPLKIELTLTDWAAFRITAIERCTAAGINPGSTTTELPRWRRLQEET